LAANYPNKDPANLFLKNSAEWGPNLELFHQRFDPEKTAGQGPYWLKNLYFVYLLELRALAKAAPFLAAQSYFTGRLSDLLGCFYYHNPCMIVGRYRVMIDKEGQLSKFFMHSGTGMTGCHRYSSAFRHSKTLYQGEEQIYTIGGKRDTLLTVKIDTPSTSTLLMVERKTPTRPHC
jgi:hypothetical protein